MVNQVNKNYQQYVEVCQKLKTNAKVTYVVFTLDPSIIDVLAITIQFFMAW